MNKTEVFTLLFSHWIKITKKGLTTKYLEISTASQWCTLFRKLRMQNYIFKTGQGSENSIKSGKIQEPQATQGNETNHQNLDNRSHKLQKEWPR